MPNDVFRAIDAVLVFGVDDPASPEGAAADALVSQYDLSNVVGRLSDVTVSVWSDLRPYYEIGRRYPTHFPPGGGRVGGACPTELGPGVVRVGGTARRAHVNGALVRLLLGDGATSPPAAANFVQ